MFSQRVIYAAGGLLLGGVVGLMGHIALSAVFGLCLGLALCSYIEKDRRMRKSYSSSLDALANAVAAKDDETNGHCRRVVQYSILIGKELGLDKRLMQQLEWGALLHDIGKIAVPDHILKKPGSLTDEEWVVMKEHAYMGWLMVKDIEFLKEAKDVVLHHHERWDGKGYPNRLEAAGIPLLARVFAIADTFDAITSDRPYRKAQSIEQARAEIQRHVGTQFCATGVAAFMKIPTSALERVQEEAKILDYEAMQLRKLKHIS